MAKKSRKLGAWAFLIGVILAIVIGVWTNYATLSDTLMQYVVMALFVIGLIIGLLNIADREVTPFLLSGTVLVIVSAFGGQQLAILPVVVKVLGALMIIFVPATIIVALKQVFSISKN